MTEHDDPYLAFASGEFQAPSLFAVYLPGWAVSPDAEQMIQILHDHEYPDIELADAEGEAKWTLRFGGAELSLMPSEDIGAIHCGPHSLSEEGKAAVEASSESLYLEVTLGEPVLSRFHAILKLLSALAPEAVGLFDYAACRVHSGEWLHSAAQSNVPPPPTTLFTLHAVQGDSIWIHSHGLMRCGTIELEMLDVPQESANDLADLLNVTAMMFIERGTHAPDDVFEVGKDLALKWIPWEEAIEGLAPEALGGVSDRDESHDHPSGVLYAPKKKRLGMFGKRHQCPSAYLEILRDNPILYLSQLETRRMSMLAKERFGVLRDIESRYRDEEDWGFLIKLGYTVDDNPESTEHLWFQVHAIEGGQIDATLLNEPYGIARMSEGQRGEHPPDSISDWTIYSPHGAFRPDQVEELSILLED